MTTTEPGYETIRRAAALMREHAAAATPTPWVKRRGPGEHVYTEEGGTWVADVATREDMRHIAGMDPVVTAALAAVLESIADRATEIADTIRSPRVTEATLRGSLTGYTEAVDAARTYLAESEGGS